MAVITPGVFPVGSLSQTRILFSAIKPSLSHMEWMQRCRSMRQIYAASDASAASDAAGADDAATAATAAAAAMDYCC